MIQDYIAYLIIAGAFAIFIQKILSFFNLLGKKNVKSGNCAGCTSGCEMKHSHLMNKSKPGKRDKYQFYL
ncbi:MAG TPA: hypothetical protein DCR40_10650 [Prolixibacteraceae bacterium]|nr:hypothetical protein [Prolixibacteraceae bacterium]